ncbi:MAG: hypothetical protein KKC64_04080, partial [Spirochaetes bacterium]|nr:hypothetical protein [Spirochaetota bacterium]
MPNKVKYGSEDIELIHSLYRDLHESETLTEFLLRFISKAGEAARSEYYGIMLFPGALSDQMHIISNNPAEYEKAYSDYLGNIDAMFSQMMDNPSKLHCYSRDYKDNDAVNTFHHEGYNIRPNGDFFYTALGYEHKIAGFIGQVKAPGADQIYSSKELNLHYHLLPILETGIASLRNKEKMRLLASQANTLEGSLMLFIYPDGAVEILNGSNQSLADELFGSIRGCIDASMHPRLSALLENLFHAARQGTLHVKDRWILN